MACGSLGQQRLDPTALRIHFEQIQDRLLAVLALDVKCAIRPPIDASDVNVCLFAQINLHAVAAICIHHKQLYNRIVAACDRIALVEHLCAGRANCCAGHNANRAFIGALDDKPLCIGRPPIACVAAHFFLSDEFRLAPADGIVFLGGYWCGLFSDLTNPQLPVANEGYKAAIGAELRIELAFLGLRQTSDRAIELSQIQIAIERHEHARPIACPLIVDDALQIADTRPLALHLLIF